MSDRITGYLALTVLCCIAAVGASLVVKTLMRPAEVRLVRFDNVGAIKLSDPVMQQGVQVGRVKSISRSGNAALLALEFSPPRRIHANYAVQVVDLGIMGDRFVAIDCGTADHAAVEPRDTLQGAFMIGTSEALGMVGQLRDVVKSFAEFSARLAFGDSTHVPLVTQYARAAWFIDSISVSLLALMRSAEVLISGHMGSLQAAIDSATGLASSLSQHAPELVTRLVSAMRSLDSAVVKVEVMVEGLGRAAQSVEGVQGAEMRQRLRSIQVKLGRVRTLLDDLQRRGLNLKVWPF